MDRSNSNKGEKMIKLLYVPTLSHTIGFWRIEAYAEALLKYPEEVAVHIKYMPGSEQNLAWDKLCVGFGETSEEIQDNLHAMFKTYDVIVFQKLQNKEGVALLEKLREEYPTVTTLCEVDDVIGFIGPSNPHKYNFRDLYKWSAEHARMSDGIITSTEFLKKDMLKMNDTIYVAPNCINPDRWQPKIRKKTHKGFKIGYVGAGAHDEDLKIAYKGLKPLLDENKALSWTIRYGGYRPDWLKRHPRIDFQSVRWHLSRYPQELANLKLDLAVAPLRDTYFNRCKSNLKWLEWASLGVPLVASDVEPYKKTKGSIHLLPNDSYAWTEYIRTLAQIREIGNPIELALECYSEYDLHKEAGLLLEWIKKLHKSKTTV
jgi:glycosyltransferase involved in cell wall biosynthesis